MNYYELFGIENPYMRFIGKNDLKEVIHGWTGNHIFFKEIINKLKPLTIIEIGSFLGQSTITMSKSIKELNIETQILCVDTWLGSSEHWRPDKCNCLCYFNYFKNGISSLYDQFIINIIINQAEQIVVPVPNTSVNAFEVFKWKNILADLIYVDGGHSKQDVFNDIMLYSQLLKPNGVLFGDDYFSWESVKNGVDKAAKHLKLKLKTHHNNFWSLK